MLPNFADPNHNSHNLIDLTNPDNSSINSVNNFPKVQINGADHSNQCKTETPLTKTDRSSLTITDNDVTTATTINNETTTEITTSSDTIDNQTTDLTQINEIKTRQIQSYLAILLSQNHENKEQMRHMTLEIKTTVNLHNMQKKTLNQTYLHPNVGTLKSNDQPFHMIKQWQNERSPCTST